MDLLFPLHLLISSATNIFLNCCVYCADHGHHPTAVYRIYGELFIIWENIVK